MSKLNLTIPLTIPQLAEMLRAQFSPQERRQLVKLMEEPEALDAEDGESLAESLRQAIGELNQYKRGEISLPTLQEFLDELPD